MLPVHRPASDLPAGLDNQQAAKPFQELKERRGPHQRLLPATEGHTLHHASTTQQPQFDRAVIWRLLLERPLHPAGRCVVRVDGELVHAPYHQGKDGDPLRVFDELLYGEAHMRGVWCYEAEDGVEEVVGCKREREGEAALLAADIEGEGDGEDD